MTNGNTLTGDETPSNGEYPLLSGINSPKDLKKLPVGKLPDLCAEIRRYLIECLAVNPGHFASSMGAVDIIVAMHYVYDAPNDHIVFDVGHQAYAHKLLTGRFREFQRQRKKRGLSGFPFPAESEYDTFVCGHAGNSISGALGMAIADSLTSGNEAKKTVALIGDASISGGLAFEGLNNASQNPNNLLIILNDNEMSIDNNVGALHRYLSTISTSARYNKARLHAYNLLKRHGLIKERGKGLVLRFNNAVKSLLSGQQNIFEGLNIRYFGPFDGHDVVKMVKVLRDIKDMKGPRILHIHTQKGKGYAPAETNPADWHAPGLFDSKTGVRASQIVQDGQSQSQPLWQEVFGEALAELAEKDPRVVAITAGMPSGTSANKISRVPGRLFDVGISEGHAVTFAGGLAAAGKHPFVAIYSSFLQRAYDNIIHDVAIQGLNVTFCIDRAGLVGEDGVTHHGMFDIPYLRIIPGLRIASPMDIQTLRDIMYSSLQWNGPTAVRYPRGKAIGNNESRSEFSKVEPGKGRMLRKREENRVLVMSIGPVGNDVANALEELTDENVYADHCDMVWIKPLDETLMEKASEYREIITVEDGVTAGGFGTAVMEWLQERGATCRVTRLGIPDKWVYQGSPGELKQDCGYDKQSIKQAVRSAVTRTE